MTSTVGATVHVHYCMDRLAGWGFTTPDSNTCGTCGMEKKDTGDCCKDKKTEFKLKTDQKQLSEFQIKAPVAEAAFLHPLPGAVTFTFSSGALLHPSAHAPPLLTGTPLYVRIRCLLI